jgi:His/Glu/Gln/Arg/opine family amino acid ABC transporter permease subunit
MQFDFAIFAENAGQIWQGFLVTIGLSAFVLLIGTPLAVLVALARQGRSRFLSIAAAAYVNTFRATPALVVLYFSFYAFPQFGVRLSPVEAALAGLTTIGTAYLSEDIRGSLRAVDPSQWRAAEALGLPYWRIVRRIILPQVIPIVVAPYITRAMLIVKSTSIAGIVAVSDLTGVTSGLVSLTYRAIEFLSVSAILYLLINTGLSLLQVWAERRFPSRSAVHAP